jgi:hypothetical protein
VGWPAGRCRRLSVGPAGRPGGDSRAGSWCDDHGGLTPYQAACEIGVTDRVARMLIKHGHLKTVSTINPINRCPQVVVMPAEVERFRREYVSLFALAKQQGRHFRKLKQEMDDAGVAAAFDVNKIGATFYRREDC